MFNVSTGYAGNQRFQEALEAAEQALVHRRRVLPADHSDIGDINAFNARVRMNA